MSEMNIVKQSLSWNEIAGELQEFFESVLEQSQLTPEQEAALGDQLKGCIEKRDRIGNILQWLEGQGDLIRGKELQLAARRRRFERLAAAIRSSLHQAMLEMGVRRVEGNEFSFTEKRNPPHVEIVNEEEIPPEFIDYTPTINKAAVKDALERGEAVSGAQLMQSNRLDVR